MDLESRVAGRVTGKIDSSSAFISRFAFVCGLRWNLEDPEFWILDCSKRRHHGDPGRDKNAILDRHGIGSRYWNADVSINLPIARW